MAVLHEANAKLRDAAASSPDGYQDMKVKWPLQALIHEVPELVNTVA
jgi:hypothetical protein